MFYRTLALVHARGIQPQAAESIVKAPEEPAGAEQKTAVE
jgi:hypothetical protein